MANELRGQSVGFYIDADMLVAVACQPARGGTRISARAGMELPRGAVTAYGCDPLALGQAIRKLLRQMNVRATAASVTLPVPADGMRSLRLPEVPVMERRTLVRGELEELSALPVGGGGFDFLWTAADVGDAGRRQAEVSAYILQDGQVDSLREALRIAGLQLTGIEPMSVTALRAYLQTAPRRPAALLFVAATYSDLCLTDGDRIRLLRRIPGGIADFGRHLEVVVGDPNRPAEPMPAETPGGRAPEIYLPPPLDPTAAVAADSMPDIPGLPPLTAEPEPEPEPESPAERPPSFLALEITRTLAFYARDYPDAPPPEALVLIGPDALHTHLTDFAETVDIPVEFAHVLDTFEPPPVSDRAGGADSLHFAAAVGAALPGADDTVAKLDLSRQEQAALTRRRAPVVLMFGMAGSTVWMLLAAAASITLAILEPQAIERKAKLTEDIARIKAERAPLLKWQEVSDMAQGMRAKSQIPAPAVMGRLAATTIPGVAVKKLELRSDGRVAIEGEALSTRSVQRFAQEIGVGKSIRTPFFEMMRQEKDGTLTFRIVGVFRGDGKEGA